MTVSLQNFALNFPSMKTIKVSLCLVMVCLLYACTYTTSKSRSTSFIHNGPQIAEQLKEETQCDSVNLEANESTTNGANSSVIKIRIYNSRKYASNSSKSSLTDLARLVKKGLDRAAAYQRYKVDLIYTSGSPVTMEATTGYTFMDQDL